MIRKISIGQVKRAPFLPPKRTFAKADVVQANQEIKNMSKRANTLEGNKTHNSGLVKAFKVVGAIIR